MLDMWVQVLWVESLPHPTTHPPTQSCVVILYSCHHVFISTILCFFSAELFWGSVERTRFCYCSGKHSRHCGGQVASKLCSELDFLLLLNLPLPLLLLSSPLPSCLFTLPPPPPSVLSVACFQLFFNVPTSHIQPCSSKAFTVSQPYRH